MNETASIQKLVGSTNASIRLADLVEVVISIDDHSSLRLLLLTFNLESIYFRGCIHLIFGKLTLASYVSSALGLNKFVTFLHIIGLVLGHFTSN